MGINSHWLKTGKGEPFEAAKLKKKGKANKKRLDQLIDLSMTDISPLANESLDKKLMTEILINIGKITNSTAKKICGVYEQIITNETDPKQRIKLVKTLLAVLKENR